MSILSNGRNIITSFPLECRDPASAYTKSMQMEWNNARRTSANRERNWILHVHNELNTNENLEKKRCL